MRYFKISASMKGIKVPEFYVTGSDSREASESAVTILSAMVLIGNSRSKTFDQIPGYQIVMEEVSSLGAM